MTRAGLMIVIAIVALIPGTTRAQVEGITRDIEAWLRGHERIWPDLVFCKLVGFGDYSMTLEVVAWFLVPDMNTFRPIRQEALLAMMEIIERHGSALAFPTTTVVMEGREGVRA